ncbi:DUF6248 family natural product biosynthesis protein [Streptomyces sp. NPDC127190]|uniref:DUF6248 family natural product biosynthesis protein n=1 Tax=unclassified Streptomyces TaxID=2593676 RepID=UPI00362C7D32
MTTWLRFIGASIMGILDPVPSGVTSPMTEAAGAWVRANAWTKGLRKIEGAYPHGFHRWCSCERGICHPCACGHHDRCVSAGGPRRDDYAGTVTDRGGFVVAVIHYGPGQRPCRWLCPCSHPANGTAPVDTPTARERRMARQRRGSYVSDDQLIWPSSPDAGPPVQIAADGEER